MEENWFVDKRQFSFADAESLSIFSSTTIALLGSNFEFKPLPLCDFSDAREDVERTLKICRSITFCEFQILKTYEMGEAGSCTKR